MAVPLHVAKADLFRSLGHPVRVRALEMLLEGPRAAHEMRTEFDVEPSSLSQQLGVLKRAGLVTSERQGSTVVYTLSTPDVADMMSSARRVIRTVLSEREVLLEEIRSAGEPG